MADELRKPEVRMLFAKPGSKLKGNHKGRESCRHYRQLADELSDPQVRRLRMLLCRTPLPQILLSFAHTFLLM